MSSISTSPIDLPPTVATMLTQLLMQSATRQNNMADAAANRQNDGAASYAENTRLDYLKNKDQISFAQGTGQRMVDESGSGRVRQLDDVAQPTSASKPA